jgi:putative aldouronate transport system substrate-binding protein
LRRRIEMKKIMALVFVCTAFIFACKAASNETVPGSTAGAKVYTTWPFVEAGSKTLSIFITDTSSWDLTAENNLFTQKAIKDTGINLDILTGGADQLSAALNSGNYPDVVIREMDYTDYLYYANQGVFAALDDYKPMEYPNIKAMFEEYPFLTDMLKGADGKLHGLADINDCLHCTYSAGRLWYYMPWMRDNNIKVPETLDEFTEYLRYVKTHDLNKNGQKDEIPIAFESGGVKSFIAAMAKAYLPYTHSEYANAYFGLAMDNGKIVEQYKDPRFREALAYIASLYKEGLIVSDAFTMTNDQFLGLLDNPDPVVAVNGSPWGVSWANFPGIRTSEYMFVIPALKGPNGQRNASNQEPWSIARAKYFITDKCKDPDLAVALYNYFIDFEIEIDAYLGPKGVTWTDPTPGSTSIYGTAPTRKLLMAMQQIPENCSWQQAGPRFWDPAFRLTEESAGMDAINKWYETGDPSVQEEAINSAAYAGEAPWYVTSMQLAEYKMPDSVFIPLMVLNDDDNTRVADINALLEPFKVQACVEFITGIRNINNDADWNAYLAELDRLGSSEMVRIRQKYID